MSTKDVYSHSLMVNLVDELEHYKPNRLQLFRTTEHYETGVTHIVEALHRLLMKKYRRSTLPRVLYLQLDS